jgi:DNA invertase Pin-like site-specific DNA recombinase
LRCAIYTRKSSEEGLEQGFNSLDAQRESCAAFIQSQKALGWVPSPTLYDDGGYSGGNMERPGLKLLLADIAARRIKVIVVYKVDRLTRSLADFAKLVELFDSHGVSFVSVTQQFNTTSSMGRLTLNVLLSFAQFEREVTGERIRDKIAASKRKGMWMGGIPPMGYAPKERSLSIIEDQAIQIREIFNLYVDLGCVRTLKAELDRRGWITPERQTKRPGAGGKRPFSRGHLYRILSNPIYIGQISHKGEVFEGNHPALIDREVWYAVQDQLESNRQGVKGRVNAINPSLLAGLLIDASGQKLVPTHTKRNSRRYRYYVSGDLHEGTAPKQTGFRIPAHELETAVTDCITNFLENESLVLDWIEQQADRITLSVKDSLRAAKAAAELLATDGRKHLAQMVERIVVRPDRLEIAIKGNLLGEHKEPIHLGLQIELKRRGLAMRLVVNNDAQARGPDKKLLELIAKGHQWLAQLTSGSCDGVGAIAAKEKITSSYVTRVIYLAFLAPDIIEAIARGLHPADLNAEKLMRMVPLPEDWAEQRRLLKIDS